MPFLRPTLTDLQAQVLVDIQTGAGSDGTAIFRRAISRALSWALANEAHGLYGYLDWIALQCVPWTATGEFLEAWAGLVGIVRKAPIALAAVATGSGNIVGRTLPSGSILTLSGSTFTTTADATVDGTGAIPVPFVAAQPGTAYSLTAGEQLSISTPVAGINASLTVSAVTQVGVDQETDDDLRTRMLQRYSAPPQGGAAADYVSWALAVPGVTRAWTLPLGMGVGTVVVYTMFDDAEAAHAGFPQGTNGVATAETRDTAATGDQLTVANAIYPLRPVTALVYSVSPTAYPVNFTIHSLVTVSSDVRLAAQAALDAAFLAISTPLNAEIELSAFETAIAGVSGMPAFTLTAPSSPIVAPLGSLPVRGTVTWA